MINSANDDKKGTGEECEHCGNNTVYSYPRMGCLLCGAPVCCSFCCSETYNALKQYKEE